jgi:uncharacterized membrane protein (DUF4010 family)
MVFELAIGADQVLQLLIQVSLAILVGALVGIEREHARLQIEKAGLKDHVLGPIFGLRSTILFALLGFMFAFIATAMSESIFLVVGAVFALTVATTVYMANVWATKHTGATTYVASLIVFFLGALIGTGGHTNFVIAGAIAIMTTIFLATKRSLVGWTSKLTQEELLSALKFGVIAFIILPLLPDRFIDPWNVINPFSVWFVVVAVSAIYFVSYIMLKQFSHKGLLLSSFLGGLISSTVTTLSLADMAKRKRIPILNAASGAYLAMLATLLGDMLVIGLVFNNLPLLQSVIAPYLVGMLVLGAFAYRTFKSPRSDKERIALSSPFALKPALAFAGVYLGLLVANALFSISFGNQSLALTTLIGSLWSSTATIASFAQLSSAGVIPIKTATQFILLAIVVSTLVKVLWVRTSGNKLFSRNALVAFSVAALAIITTAAVQFLLA